MQPLVIYRKGATFCWMFTIAVFQTLNQIQLLLAIQQSNIFALFFRGLYFGTPAKLQDPRASVGVNAA